MDNVPSTPFTTVLNFRDVGQTINTLTSHPHLRPSLFFRSGQPTSASASDASTLSSAYKIRTILDLRSKTEHIRASEAHPSPNHIPNAKTELISLTGSSFEKALFFQLGLADKAFVFHFSLAHHDFILGPG